MSTKLEKEIKEVCKTFLDERTMVSYIQTKDGNLYKACSSDVVIPWVKVEAFEKAVGGNEQFQEFNGKMWSNSIGEDLTFDQAKDFAKNCRDGGFTDWRVPTAKELADTIDWEKGTSAISRGANGSYWSSTQYSTTSGWYLHFYSSYSSMYGSSKAYGFSVRCLRDLEKGNND